MGGNAGTCVRAELQSRGNPAHPRVENVHIVVSGWVATDRGLVASRPLRNELRSSRASLKPGFRNRSAFGCAATRAGLRGNGNTPLASGRRLGLPRETRLQSWPHHPRRQPQASWSLVARGPCKSKAACGQNPGSESATAARYHLGG